MQRTVILLFIILFFLLNQTTTFASDNFLTSYDVKYQVQDSGTTHVDFDISLTNKNSKYYASSYKIQLGFSHVQNVKASDAIGAIVPTVFKETKGTSIEIPFNQRVVGKENTVSFVLSFDTDDIVQKQGGIWEVNIPGISNQNDFSDFKAHVNVPSFLGKPTYIKPIQPTNTLDFDRDQLGTSGISIAFGDKQNYEFALSYHLKNVNIFPVGTQIALPPSTNYQTVAIHSISVKPLNVVKDPDGNWLAQYTLLPSEKKEITVKGNVQISLYPKKAYESEENLKKYLVPKKYWESDSPKVKRIAQTLKSPRAIYEYVLTHLTYDFSRISQGRERLGAEKLLDNPNSAVCLEFTDLFIALARAQGIPAREVDGFAYTQNASVRPLSGASDILHSWPEFYDREKGNWVMVDPTWANTTGGIDYFQTLDFDHFAFVIKGADSMYPVPAGGYKTAPYSKEKDVNVTFADGFEEQIPTIAVNTAKFAEKGISGFPLSGTVEFRNSGEVISPAQTVVFSAYALAPAQKTVTVGEIPPYGTITVPLSYQTGSFLTKTKARITIQLGSERIIKEIVLSPFFLTPKGIIGGIIFALFIITIPIATGKARRLPFFGQKR